MSASIVLAAHGSNALPHVNERIRQLAHDLQRTGEIPSVTAAFHQGDPHFSEVLDQLPAGKVVVIPFMTSAGYYCDEVLPREFRRNCDFDPNLVRITPPVGAHPMLEELLANRIHELVGEHDLRESNVAVILVGHGTPRHIASRNTSIRLADGLQNKFADAVVIPAFIDDEPSVASAYGSIGNRNCIVLPFFMGTGMHAIEDLPRMFGFTQKLNDEPLGRRDGERSIVLDRPIGLDAGMIEIIKDLARWDSPPDTSFERTQRMIRLGTRGSKMALWQAKQVAGLLPKEHRIEIVELSTLGDRDRGRPIDELPVNAPFTDDIETALIEGRIDVAVHSLKDLPLCESPETKIAALLRRGDARECVVTRDRVTLAKLEPGAKVGTSCARRAIQVLRLRPDLQIVPLRGPVDDRVRQVHDGEMDAAILAWVGLQRLDLLDAVDEVFELEQLLPAPGQAALAVQVRADDHEMIGLISQLDDCTTCAETTLELDLQRAVQRVGNLTVAAFAQRRDQHFHLHARIMCQETNEIIDVCESDASIQALIENVLGQLGLFQFVEAQEQVS
ncbi:MAG: hypothetical protein DHS20C16_13000 [Phycisphaerae bacterium]|nr:MAG: hypothetical protein DHS20C16_13000 [Phycisphaerae bacterium]